uniref:Uncharacterized protein n=1 Tax=Oryza sativa subsp. japonica TaxID=39947 RepID=Q7F0Q4_ORYSJ|nr:hypothetical protein [Oryza sativa Japonica Group]
MGQAIRVGIFCASIRVKWEAIIFLVILEFGFRNWHRRPTPLLDHGRDNGNNLLLLLLLGVIVEITHFAFFFGLARYHPLKE